MAEQQDPLQSLWQQQSVNAIDMSDVRKRFRAQRWKQRCYLTLDILAMLPLTYVLLFMQDEFAATPMGWLGLWVLGGICLVFVLYIAWLRRHALFGGEAQTEDHLKKLSKQFANNARIAMLTKHSCWVTVLMLFVYYLVMYEAGEIDAEQWRSILFILLPLTCVVMFAMGGWAHRRQRRFERDWERLQSMQMMV